MHQKEEKNKIKKANAHKPFSLILKMNQLPIATNILGLNNQVWQPACPKMGSREESIWKYSRSIFWRLRDA